MGQKTSPIALRLGINRDWNSRWYASDKKTWSKWLIEDRKIRDYFLKNIKKWSLSLIEINRTNSEINIIINTAKPGVVLGQEAQNLKKIKLDISKLIRKNKDIKLNIEVKTIENPDVDALIIANEIASSLENRSSFRIAQKKAISKTMRAGAKGIKTQVSGRLNGVDMARSEGYSKGVVPMQTFRNNLDYAIAEAHTTYGIIGVKVWISKGELLKIKTQPSKKSSFKSPKNDLKESLKTTTITKSKIEEKIEVKKPESKIQKPLTETKIIKTEVKKDIKISDKEESKGGNE